MNKIEEYWNVLFHKYNIINKIGDNNSYVITSAQINELKESRLMTKFDQKSNLPSIFEKNNLSILPISRGSYMIAKVKAYKNIDYNDKIKSSNFGFPKHIETIDYNNITSESIALNCAYACGIIDDIIGEKSLPTVSGRMSTSSFDFNIHTYTSAMLPVKVNKSQCEIDGGYESKNKFLLIEAKNFLSKDFIIRQLYYPYRLWDGKIKKEIVPVYMIYSNNIFSCFIYKFKNLLDYNSLELIEQKNYIISPQHIHISEIKKDLDRTTIIKESKIPFPQADSFERLIDLLHLLYNNELTSEDITLNYDFDERQTEYYTNAGRYLGLIEKKREEKNTIFSLSDQGKEIFTMPFKQKYLSLVHKIIEHEVFYKVLKEYFSKGFLINSGEVFKIMKNSNVYNVTSINTLKRRSQTVIKWVKWILNLENRYIL